MAYLLDANVFIQAKNLQYGFDFCPAFWDWLAQAHGAGRLHSIRHVGDELSGFGDELSAWADGLDETFFVPPDAAVLAAAQDVSAWVLQQGYEPAAVNTFLQVADFWLVAAALAGNHTVVTHEVASPSAKKIKIPNVCVGLGVDFTSPYQMLRKEQARFVLGPTQARLTSVRCSRSGRSPLRRCQSLHTVPYGHDEHLPAGHPQGPRVTRRWLRVALAPAARTCAS